MISYYWQDGSLVPYRAEVIHEKCVSDKAAHRFEGLTLPELMLVKVAVGKAGSHSTPERLTYADDEILVSCPLAEGMEAVFVSGM